MLKAIVLLAGLVTTGAMQAAPVHIDQVPDRDSLASMRLGIGVDHALTFERAPELELPAFNAAHQQHRNSLDIWAWSGLVLVLLRWLEPVFRPRGTIS